MTKAQITVIVEPAPRRKGWLWREVGKTGSVAAVSPKNYDTKALAKRAGDARVRKYNAAQADGFNQLAAHLPVEYLPVGFDPKPFAVLEVVDS